MCGVFCVLTHNRSATETLVEGLRRLEYRGYDSLGIGLQTKAGLERLRVVGRVQDLNRALERTPLQGPIGIGHTRWATHGVVNEENAHPHGNDCVLVVQNGIIENFRELRDALQEKGVSFESKTDTEVLAHLVQHHMEQHSWSLKTLAQNFRDALRQAKGSFSCIFLLKDFPGLALAYRQGHNPLAVGRGKDATFCGSDTLSLAGYTKHITYLEDGDVALLTPDAFSIWDKDGIQVMRASEENLVSASNFEKGGHEHFMRKEIFEQPHILDNLFRMYVPGPDKLQLPSFGWSWSALHLLNIVGCGTAYYAGAVAKHWFEKLAHLPVVNTFASELHVANAPLTPRELMILISQSGETADTIAALAYGRTQDQHILSVINVLNSSLSRLSDGFLYTHAGPEIGVASTKAFTAQLFVLLLLAIDAGKKRKPHLKAAKANDILKDLEQLPQLLEHVLGLENDIIKLAKTLYQSRHILYLGRGPYYPVALEGALKMKEITYIHAEAYAAGELKHGPIALLEEGLPVIIVAPTGPAFEKNANSLQEVLTRGANAIFLTDEPGCKACEGTSATTLTLPHVTSITGPFVYTLALQLLAYHTALLRGCDIDRPRNLAKSVTVE
jgi:glucosamine--fructose-6-phosphate aminotransferase (isomerizing)